MSMQALTQETDGTPRNWRDLLPAGVEVQDCQDEEDWLKVRLAYISASEAACLAGESTYKSPYSLWVEKTERIVDQEEFVERFFWGHIDEPAICERLLHELPDHNILDPGRFAFFVNEKYAEFGATPDRFVIDPAGQMGVLELKSRDGNDLGNWKEGVPNHILIQMQVQLMATGLDYGIVAARFANRGFRWARISRNGFFVQQLHEAGREFMHLVKTHTPPPIDGHEATAEALKRLHPDDNGETVALPNSIKDADARLEEAKAQLKHWEAVEKEAKNTIRAALGPNTYGTTDTFQYSYKTQERGTYLEVEDTPLNGQALTDMGIPFKQKGGAKFRTLRRKDLTKGRK